MVLHKVEAVLTAEYIKRTIDGDGNDGQLEFISQLECSFSKDTHVSREGARSFGEDNE